MFDEMSMFFNKYWNYFCFNAELKDPLCSNLKAFMYHNCYKYFFILGINTTKKRINYINKLYY